MPELALGNRDVAGGFVLDVPSFRYAILLKAFLDSLRSSVGGHMGSTSICRAAGPVRRFRSARRSAPLSQLDRRAQLRADA